MVQPTDHLLVTPFFDTHDLVLSMATKALLTSESWKLALLTQMDLGGCAVTSLTLHHVENFLKTHHTTRVLLVSKVSMGS